MRDLIARIEAATGPSFALDDDIAQALGWPDVRFTGIPRPYTASLDAAVSLVPDGLRWHCQWVQSQGFAWATAGEGDPVREPFGSRLAKARTPALALCAAALRALPAIQEAADAP